MAELKPCPFCGSKDIRQSYYDPFDGYQGDFGFYRNKCAGCGCELKASRVEDVNNAWNRRAESEELKFTRQFIHEHGLEFELASAWGRRAEDGK